MVDEAGHVPLVPAIDRQRVLRGLAALHDVRLGGGIDGRFHFHLVVADGHVQNIGEFIEVKEVRVLAAVLQTPGEGESDAAGSMMGTRQRAMTQSRESSGGQPGQ